MRLYAIGDIHLSYGLNREALTQLEPHPDDGLILCGDIGETREHLELAFRAARDAFKHVFWVPGNHELYSLPVRDTARPRGIEKYQECLDIARDFGIHTPEDPYMRWEGEGGPCIIAPIFTLYDYSFRPDHITRDNALKWAEEEGVIATDEAALFPDPYLTRDAWCDARVTYTEERLMEATKEMLPLIIINHWPLREDLVYIPNVPRFSIWCGTKRTDDWHTRFNAQVVVSGHLHVRRTDWRDGVRFEECSLGYPAQWKAAKDGGRDINAMLREILPGPPTPPGPAIGPIWRLYG